MGEVTVNSKRNFHPHHTLLAGARVMLKDAEEEPGHFYHKLSAMMLSAFALEAMANSFGDHIYDRWKDFESSNPMAKIRLVAERIGVEVDIEKEPYSTALWLIKFRNKVAHAKPYLIVVEKNMSYTEAEKLIKEQPPSKLEMEVTIENAKRSVKAVNDIFERWCDLIPRERDQVVDLLYDGWFSRVSQATNESD